MPVLISPIDEICRQKQRDVLTVEFHCYEKNFLPDYRQVESREMILDWLDENNVPYFMCGAFSDGEIFDRYRGQLYIDVPFDKSNDLYLKIEAFLENPDGSMKFEGAYFRYYLLEDCMENTILDN